MNDDKSNKILNELDEIVSEIKLIKIMLVVLEIVLTTVILLARM